MDKLESHGTEHAFSPCSIDWQVCASTQGRGCTICSHDV